ncbi:MAG: undecaprenyl-diphosphate phosphatase [archaeon]
MDLIQAIILGLIQGITEWLPISSQGQVTIAALALFNIPMGKALSYSIFLHIGTLIAAVIYFRKELKELIELKEKKLRNFLGIAVIASAITAIPSYLLLTNILESGFALMIAIALFLIVTGVIQLKAKSGREGEMNKRNALFLGLGQGFSVLPGISRSGVTTSVMLFEGFTPEKAFRLSFLLSIPSVLIAEIGFGLVETIEFELNLIISIIIAAVIGLISMDLFIRAARRINFSLFCFIFAAIYLVMAFVL